MCASVVDPEGVDGAIVLTDWSRGDVGDLAVWAEGVWLCDAGTLEYVPGFVELFGGIAGDVVIVGAISVNTYIRYLVGVGQRLGDAAREFAFGDTRTRVAGAGVVFRFVVAATEP